MNDKNVWNYSWSSLNWETGKNTNADTFEERQEKKRRMLTVLTLISEGIDVNLTNRYAETPLMLAAETDDLDLVQILVRNGADINKVDNSGDTALDHALFFNNAKIAQYLVENGAKKTSIKKFLYSNQRNIKNPLVNLVQNERS